MQIGRIEIFTDYDEITNENIISVLQDAYAHHTANANRIDYLLNFDAGVQPQIREKQTRKDIDVHCVDNIAHQAVAFNESYHWSNPITWIQRGAKDSGQENETDAIALLNECYFAENIESKTQQLGRFIEICGIGYVFIDVNTDYTDGDSYFKYEILDPRNTFIVKSSKLGHKKLLAVTYSQDGNGTIHFTCFTQTTRYEIVCGKIINGKNEEEEQWTHRRRSGEENPLNAIPIIECIRSYDRMGCFEREIDDMLSLNLLESDIINATDETVQAIWHCNDVDFPVDEKGEPIHPEHNDWLQTYTSKDGKTPFVTPLAINFDYVGNLNYVTTKRAFILEKLCVPCRNDNSGGSTGTAMNSATGWNAAENLANAIENITIGWKMEEVKVVLKAIQINPDIKADSPLLTLRAMDIKPSIKRNRNYELTVKANFISTLLDKGIYGEHVLKEANVFPDPQQVWNDSKDLIVKMQESKLSKAENTNSNKTTSDDIANQITNSPLIDKDRG